MRTKQTQLRMVFFLDLYSEKPISENTPRIIRFNLSALGDNFQEWLYAISHEFIENAIFRTGEVADYLVAHDLTTIMED